MYDISALVPFFTPVTRQVNYSFASPARLCAANNDRPILYLYNPGPNDVVLSTPTGVAAGVDYLRVAALSGLKWTWMLDGPMSTYEWWVRNAGGTSGGSVSVIEILWQPK